MSVHRIHIRARIDETENSVDQLTACGLPIYRVSDGCLEIMNASEYVDAWPEGAAKCKACRDAEKAAARAPNQMRQVDRQRLADRLFSRLYRAAAVKDRPNPRDRVGTRVFVQNLAAKGDADATTLAGLCGWPVDGPQLVKTVEAKMDYAEYVNERGPETVGT